MMEASEQHFDPFSSLTPKAWFHIFRLLSYVDRIRCEMVSKRLASLCTEAWSLAAIETFDAAECEPIRFSRSSFRAKAVVAICARIGPTLRTLRLTDQIRMSWSSDFASIARTCVNIKSIRFFVGSSSNIVPPGVRFDPFTGLKLLSFVSPSCAGVAAPASVFLSVPSSVLTLIGLRVLPLADARFDTCEQLERFFAERSSLRTVVLGGPFVRDEDIRGPRLFRMVSTHCPFLKKLILTHQAGDFCADGIESLSGMIELRVPCTPISDEQLVAVCSASPVLEAFDLGWHGFDTVGLRGFRAVSKLAKLRELLLCGEAIRLSSSEIAEVICELVANSGQSLRRLHFYGAFSTPTIEAIALGCPFIRDLVFGVTPESAAPAGIRSLIDHIVGSPTWNSPEDQLTILVGVDRSDAQAIALFGQLVAPGAQSLPAGVDLRVMPVTRRQL